LQQSNVDDETATTTDDTDVSNTHTTLETSESLTTPTAQHITTDSIQDLDISNMTLSPSKSSTPRPSRHQQHDTRVLDQATPAQFADYSSAYEALRQEVNGTAIDSTSLHEPTITTHGPEPSTPNAQTTTYLQQTPQSSPFLPQPPSQARPSATRKTTDPLLHRVLDKNYRIQATPLTAQRHKHIPADTPHTANRNKSTRNRRLFNDTLSSSPEVAPPQLHEELFSPQRPNARSHHAAPRTPGVSVLTPGPKTKQARQSLPRADLAAPGNAQHRKPSLGTAATSGAGAWDFDSDDDDTADLQFGSPPKTMQFHVPQNRLLKTPGSSFSLVLPLFQPFPFAHPKSPDLHSKHPPKTSLTRKQLTKQPPNSKRSLPPHRSRHPQHGRPDPPDHYHHNNQIPPLQPRRRIRTNRRRHRPRRRRRRRLQLTTTTTNTTTNPDTPTARPTRIRR
jgi:hypothetical protein